MAKGKTNGDGHLSLISSSGSEESGLFNPKECLNDTIFGKSGNRNTKLSRGSRSIYRYPTKKSKNGSAGKN